MLLERKSLTSNILPKCEALSCLNISRVRDILSKSRKSTSDFRCTYDYFKSFKLAEQIRQRNLASFKEFVDQLSFEYFAASAVIHDPEIEMQRKTWLIASGRIRITRFQNEIPQKEEKVFGEFDMFGEDDGDQDKWSNFTAVAQVDSVLLSIPNSKLSKIVNSSTLSQETVKRSFICACLSIQNQGSLCKSFIKKFAFKMYSKSSQLFAESDRLDQFILIKKGSVELHKTITDLTGKNRIKVGIVHEGSFLYEAQSLRDPEAVCECTAEAVTAVQAYVILRSDLLKYFSQITGLQSQLSAIVQQKHFVRDSLILTHLNSKSKPKDLEPKAQAITPLFRKSISGFRTESQTTANHNFIGPAKYDQMVANEQKIWIPLSNPKNKYQHRLRTRIKVEQVNKILKEEKMNRIMVRQLVNKRVKGIHDSDIKIQLKPTLFKEKISGQFDTEMFAALKNSSFDWQQQHPHMHNRTHSNFKNQSDSYYDLSVFDADKNPRMKSMKEVNNDQYSPLGTSDTGLINELSKNLLDYKKNVLCLKTRPERKQRLLGSCDLSHIVRQKMKGKVYYEYVNPPRQKFQCELNKAGDALVFTQTQSGKLVRRRIRLTGD